MTAGEFADLVLKMRTAQKNFFRTKLRKHLEESRAWEKEVDAVLRERSERENDRLNPSLFAGLT